MSAEPTAAVLNRTLLEEAAGGDAELVGELATLYLGDAEAHLEDLATAAAEGDLDRLGRVAHGLKGSSATIGAEEAADCFRVLEEQGRAGETAGIESAVQHARDAFARLRVELSALAA